MKCHICNKPLETSKYYFSCPNHLYLTIKNNYVFEYRAAIESYDFKYEIGYNNKTLLTTLYNSLEIFNPIISVKKQYDINIIDDVPQFLPVFNKLIKLKTFS